MVMDCNQTTIIEKPMGPGEGSYYNPKGGEYYLKVNAMGEWKIKIKEVDQVCKKNGPH